MELNREIVNLLTNAEDKLRDAFKEVDNLALFNQSKVLDAFRDNAIGQRHFAGTNGYGYDDIGRDTLCKLLARIFGTESAIVSPLIVSGTHALSLTLFALLKHGDKMLSISGAPYDTLQTIIKGNGNGSLADNDIDYIQVDLIESGLDYAKIEDTLRNNKIKLVFIGRSRGYEWRNALTVSQIKKAADLVKSISPDTIVMCDNCYGEFTDYTEPTQNNVDIVAGSLIKNLGGGIAPTGGYVCGKSELIDKVACRLTAPSIGMEVGSYASGYRTFYQGLFCAPHVVACALKSAMLFSQVFTDLGYSTLPEPSIIPSDIICSIQFETKDQAIDFIRAVQKASPIDSNVVPFPWDMPGYDSQVIMAAGTFVAGASIELSADSPLTKPYTAYIQGALTYEHAKLAIMYCLESLSNKKG
ncbi:MAG: methionine gamma-lyase family protein [Clostridia bacterium]|nr:methionine gamma-lyase family protein [Clostridia bacterium]